MVKIVYSTYQGFIFDIIQDSEMPDFLKSFQPTGFEPEESGGGDDAGKEPGNATHSFNLFGGNGVNGSDSSAPSDADQNGGFFNLFGTLGGGDGGEKEAPGGFSLSFDVGGGDGKSPDDGGDINFGRMFNFWAGREKIFVLFCWFS